MMLLPTVSAPDLAILHPPYSLVVKQTRRSSIDQRLCDDCRKSLPCRHKTHEQRSQGPDGKLSPQLFGLTNSL